MGRRSAGESRRKQSAPRDGVLYVSPQDDFGLALNAAVRMYRRDVSPETLALLETYFRQVMRYIDSRTLWCALADLQPEAADLFCPEIPEGQECRFTALRDAVAREYFLRSVDDEYMLHCRVVSCGLVGQDARKGMFADGAAFLTWLKKLRESGQEPAGYREVPEVPLPPECAERFGLLVQLMCAYSVKRQTYMPLTAAQFALRVPCGRARRRRLAHPD